MQSLERLLFARAVQNEASASSKRERQQKRIVLLVGVPLEERGPLWDVRLGDSLADRQVASRTFAVSCMLWIGIDHEWRRGLGAMAHLENKFGPARLQIHQQKCKVFCGFGHVAMELPSARLPLTRVSLSSGSVFLGVPVGADHFIRQYTEQTLSKLEDMLLNSSRLQSCLGKFLLLRACFGACRVTHLLRSLDFNDGAFLAAKSSIPFRRVVDDVLQGTTTEEQYTLACLASHRGD